MGGDEGVLQVGAGACAVSDATGAAGVHLRHVYGEIRVRLGHNLKLNATMVVRLQRLARPLTDNHDQCTISYTAVYLT